MKIVSARITPLVVTSLMDFSLPEVFATLEDGSEIKLFSYYPDEISFTPDEFVGLTITQAHRLHFEKDKEYLQS